MNIVKKPNKLVFLISLVLISFYTCINFINYKLFVYEGITVDLIEFTFLPCILWIFFIIIVVFFVGCLSANDKNILFMTLCTAINLFMIFICSNNIPSTIRHYYTSIYLKDIRYSINEITLNDLRNVSSENHIIYIGRPSCDYCTYTYDKLYKSTLSQPIAIKYYNTENDRINNNDEMTEVLSKYGVSEVPIVLFVINGKLDKTIYYEDIINSFEKIVDYYKTKGIYFLGE